MVDDKLVEDDETLYLEVGEKVLTATIEDNEESKAEVERIVVRNDNGREFSNWDYKHKVLGISHRDFITYYIELKKPINKASTLNFKQIRYHPGRDANKEDIKLEESKFWVNEKEDSRFVKKWTTYSSPKRENI